VDEKVETCRRENGISTWDSSLRLKQTNVKRKQNKILSYFA
jgi:hypothetical protein